MGRRRGGLNSRLHNQKATYNENNQKGCIRELRYAINFGCVQTYIKGSPVLWRIPEEELYHWGDRYSIYTGLPTLIGWIRAKTAIFINTGCLVRLHLAVEAARQPTGFVY